MTNKCFFFNVKMKEKKIIILTLLFLYFFGFLGGFLPSNFLILLLNIIKGNAVEPN